MTIFYVRQRVHQTLVYEVEAESPDEAIRLVLAGEVPEAWEEEADGEPPTVSTGTMKRTEAQNARQAKEHRDNGRYAKTNPCEVCDKSAGIDYYSHPLCNKWGYGVVLCKKCAKATEGMRAWEFRAYVEGRRG